MMSSKLIFVALISFFVCCLTAPIAESDLDDRKHRSALENSNLFHGDILLSKRFRFAMKDPSLKWPKNTIPYLISDERINLRFQIQKAMRYIESKTCIRFVERTNQKNYVNIIKDEDNCYSMVGRQGGMQNLSLGDGCEPFGIILHELMHSIGFDHQQNRYDRDEYLDIYWKNIDPEEYDQFEKLTPDNSVIFTPFDFKSIMLYDELAFSKDKVSKTMRAKNPKIRLPIIWRRKTLSKSDIISINKLYQCL